MDKESLIKARELVLKIIDGSEIMTWDKIELLINLNTFLNPETYEEDKKVLMNQYFKRKLSEKQKILKKEDTWNKH